jgi:hypothetical protein
MSKNKANGFFTMTAKFMKHNNQQLVKDIYIFTKGLDVVEIKKYLITFIIFY